MWKYRFRAQEEYEGDVRNEKLEEPVRAEEGSNFREIDPPNP